MCAGVKRRICARLQRIDLPSVVPDERIGFQNNAVRFSIADAFIFRIDVIRDEQ
jgi:hypothetical protein